MSTSASSRSAAEPAGAGRSASERAGIGAASRARVRAADLVNAGGDCLRHQILQFDVARSLACSCHHHRICFRVEACPVAMQPLWPLALM